MRRHQPLDTVVGVDLTGAARLDGASRDGHGGNSAPETDGEVTRLPGGTIAKPHAHRPEVNRRPARWVWVVGAVVLLLGVAMFRPGGEPVAERAAAAVPAVAPAADPPSVTPAALAVPDPGTDAGHIDVAFPDAVLPDSQRAVRCSVPGQTGASAQGFLIPTEGSPTPAELRDGSLVLVVTLSAGRGTVELPGVLSADVEWPDAEAESAGRCNVHDVRAHTAGVYGKVRGAPLQGATVHGCDTSAGIVDGEFFLPAIPGVPCTLTVYVRDHGRSAQGPAVFVTPTEGQDVEVVLEYPAVGDLLPLDEKELQFMRSLIADLRESCDPPTCDELIAQLVAESGEAEAGR